MGESLGSVRLCITVPAELKKEMGGIKELVNWSGVAAEAFRRKLLDLRATRIGETMDDVIARMKAAKEREENRDYQAGHAAGDRWAKRYATPKELDRLENGEWQYGEDTGKLASEITAGEESPTDFWRRVLADEWRRIEDDDFARGF